VRAIPLPTGNARPGAGTELDYPGSELEIFAEATVWRTYWQGQIKQFIGQRVLEVGAGIGSVTASLARHGVEHWVALEPDPGMARDLDELRRYGALPACCEPRLGTIADLAPGERFDTVLYADVLEHIQDDRQELARAARHLDSGGTLIVLAPAHQWLYSPFDAAIGHFRRYAVSDLLNVTPARMTMLRARYLDCAGLAASWCNRLALKQAVPTATQIKVWDRLMVRASRLIDPVIGYRFGKSVLVVWRKS
jgi:ubiquinone/menaquinone biosynthesis C-methylase UbiE